MKRAKVTISPDLVTNPPVRIVKHSPSGSSKTVVGVNQSDPFFKFNSYSRKYEVIVEFRNEPGDEKYLLMGDRLDMERLIAKMQYAIRQMPAD
jgi:hypothetical protein